MRTNHTLELGIGATITDSGAYQDQAAKNQGSADQDRSKRLNLVSLVVSTKAPPIAGGIGPILTVVKLAVFEAEAERGLQEPKTDEPRNCSQEKKTKALDGTT